MTHAFTTPPEADGPDRPAGGGLPTGIAAALAALDRTGGSWALLRGAETLADDPGDVDVLIAPAAVPAARRELRDAAFAPVAAPGRGTHRFFHGYDPETDRWTKLDLVSELAFGRFQELPSELAAGCLARRDRTTWPPQLDPDDAFWTLLLHSLLDRPTLRPDDPDRLRAAAAGGRADGPAAAEMARHLPLGWSAARVLETARAGDVAALGRLGRSVRRGWWRRRPGRVAGRWASNRILRRGAPLSAVLRGGGLSVALLGPDGAGKSTLAARLVDAFPVPTRRIYLGLYGHGASGGGAGPGGRIGLPGRLVWLWRRSLAATWGTRRGRIVVFDRHVLDLALATPGAGRRSRIRRGLLVRAIPTPGLSLILDVPGAELFRRKGEHDPATLEAQRARYLELGQRLRRATVIDASVAPELVRRRVVAAIWAARTGGGAPASDRHA